MLGTLRLLLALLVALSHAEVRWFGLNPGVSAVAGFYVISGYVMMGLLRRHYASPARIGHFYLDRAFRLLPAYYAVVAVTALWYLWHGPQFPYLSNPPSVAGWLNNLLVVPLNFSMWNEANRFVMVPPAWSLGAEIQFYLLFPLLVFLRIRWLAMAASIAVFAAAFSGLIQTEWYGYRLLPGVLFMFLLGAWLHDRHHDPARPSSRATDRAVLVLVGALAAAALVGWHTDVLRLPYNREILLGLGFTLPMLHLLARRAPKRWDERAGDLSYGLFLSHFLAFWLWPGAEEGALALTLRLLLATAIAWGLHRLVERPVIVWRRRLLRDSGARGAPVHETDVRM